MPKYTAADIKKLREETGAGMLDCKKCLEKADGDYEEAKKFAIARGLAKAEKKSDRETKEGYIASYVHANAKVAALVEILCETDFVARNDEFKSMAKDVAMQVVAMGADDVEDLLKQDFIKDPSLTIEELVKRTSGKIGEKFVVNRFVRYTVGE
ncbi:MAG: translation elongation factor Ts [Candidatus Pacebacteria bacterium]|nr:translation elongation factor Ts [Candidatus Paceibacterota bacterium]